MEINLAGRRALVTGGSSGIGAALVKELAEAGARVGFSYLTHGDKARELEEQIRSRGREARAFRADVADAGDVVLLFTEMDKAWGGIDILVNSAGIDGPRALGWEADTASWEKVIEVNLFGLFGCCRQALSRMIRQRRGVILNISSVHEIIAWSGYSAYAASKAAVGMLTRTLAQEAAPYGVRVLALGPGAIKTPINRSVWSDPASLRDLLAKIPLGRLGEPEDISRLAVVLVSDVASYVTGCTVFIDGGMTDYPDFATGG